MPPLKSPEDAKNYPDFMEYLRKGAEKLRKGAEKYNDKTA